MKTVYKYGPFHYDNTNYEVSLPLGAKILHGNAQNELLFIWAEVETLQKEKELQSITFVSSGRLVPDDHAFINTFLINDGRLVFHLYAQSR